MTEPNNAVLQEQIKQLRKDFQDFKISTREDIRELEKDMEKNNTTTNQLSIMMSYVKDTVLEMKEMMNSFIIVQNDQNKKMGESFTAQNEKIDGFINSDTRMNHKRQFVVSVLQVASGIIIALLGFWASGQI